MYQSPVERQEEIEASLSKKQIRERVLDELTSDMDMLDKIIEGIEYLEAWTETESTYESKAMRKAHIASLDLQDVVTTVYVAILAQKAPTTLNNLACQLAGSLQFEENYQGVTAMAEVLAVLCHTDVYELYKPNKYASVLVIANFELSDDLKEFIDNAQYLPPSKTLPKFLIHNRSSGYRTIKHDSLILGGSHNHHNEDICLDVLNIMNSIPLVLNQEILSIQQESETDLDDIEDFEGTALEKQKAISQQKENWGLFLKRSELAYSLMEDEPFYLTNKVDKRGRIYTQGYAINIQGNSYQKACIDLARKEVVEVPEGFFK